MEVIHPQVMQISEGMPEAHGVVHLIPEADVEEVMQIKSPSRVTVRDSLKGKDKVIHVEVSLEEPMAEEISEAMAEGVGLVIRQPTGTNALNAKVMAT